MGWSMDQVIGWSMDPGPCFVYVRKSELPKLISTDVYLWPPFIASFYHWPVVLDD